VRELWVVAGALAPKTDQATGNARTTTSRQAAAGFTSDPDGFFRWRVNVCRRRGDDLMSNTKSFRAARLDRIGDLVDDTPGVHVRDLPPFTTLLVWTMNSVYRVVITQWPEVYIQGGVYFPDPTWACLDGASIGERCPRVGWIGVGLLVEIRSGGWHVITSPVRAITTEQSSSLLVH
jgi:hypothetical protein